MIECTKCKGWGTNAANAECTNCNGTGLAKSTAQLMCGHIANRLKLIEANADQAADQLALLTELQELRAAASRVADRLAAGEYGKPTPY